MIGVAVKKNENETTASLMRRFSKRVQGSGIVRKAKSLRYHLRTVSKQKKRNSALRRITNKEERERKEKLGPIQPRTRGRGGAR